MSAAVVQEFVVPSALSRARSALAAARILARDHTRLDQALVFIEAVNIGKVVRLASKLGDDAEGTRLLSERPRIDRKHVDFDALRALPDGSLGREYTRFLDQNGITPDAFEELPGVGDERIAWIMLRMRQTHDLWHVLTGYAPDVLGEVRLQAFTFAQTGAPSAIALTLFGALRWTFRAEGNYREIVRAYRRGKATRFLPTFRWEDEWATPLEELRARLGCPA
jgi:ubiquinone biosynthesis protein COQ4